MAAASQKVVKSVDRNYRADVLISITRLHSGSASPVLGRLVVEIDGHDLHERTKAQASHDKGRDREMLYEGLLVMRFTGSDVFRDTHRCVEEVQFQLDRMANQAVLEALQSGRVEQLLFGD